MPKAWKAVGSGTGLANQYLFAIYEKAAGFPGAVLKPTGGLTAAGVWVGLPLPSAPSNSIYGGAAIPNIDYTFLGGREYSIQIAVFAEVGGEVIMSQWSDPVFITVEPSSGVVYPPQVDPVLLGPQPGATDVNPGVAFSWTPVAGAAKYEFILATDSALTTQVVKENVSQPAYGPITLEYGKDYWYAVRVIEPTPGVQSIGSFTTMAEPIVTPIQEVNPAWIWAVVIIGAILVIVVIALIFTTRRVS